MFPKSFNFKSLLSFFVFSLFLFSSRGYSQETPGSYYVVKEGDTLWGISSSHYSDPFLWPRLWGKNQSIPHPDKIYPGKRIFLPSEEALKEIEKKEAANSSSEELSSETAPLEASIQEDGLDVDETMKTGTNNLDEEVKKEEESYPGQPELEVKRPSVWSLPDLATGGFILKSSSQGEKKGEIVASENEHTLLGEGDVIYVVPEEARSFHIGERYTIYEPIKSIHHPKTHRLMGKLIRIKGVVEIIPNSMASPDKGVFSARIVKSYQLINLKDFLTSYHSLDPINVMINEIPFPDHLKGNVIASRDTKENNGEHDIVYLDKGSQDGVKPGHLFVVFKEGKQAQFYSPTGREKLPRRIIAELEVISVQKETSTAVVSKSLEPIVVGDQISNPPLNP